MAFVRIFEEQKYLCAGRSSVRAAGRPSPLEDAYLILVARWLCYRQELASALAKALIVKC
jgi:hypothetical protein